MVAERRVEIVSKGTGQCLSVMAEEGDLVRTGVVLAELDKEELAAQIQQTPGVAFSFVAILCTSRWRTSD